MKMAMMLTMDGLVRTLRCTVHDLAEAAERGYASAVEELPAKKTLSQMREQKWRQDDDLAGS